MNADIQGKIDAIKAPFQSIMDAADAIPALVDAAEKVAHDAGFTEGQASIVLPDPSNPSAQYTQADMDSLAAKVRLENDQEVAGLNGQITDLQNQVNTLNGQVKDLSTSVAAQTQALVNFKAQELAKLQALAAEFQG